MNRKEQQAELMYSLGLLLRPIQDLIDYPDQQTPQTRARASGKFMHDREAFFARVSKFCSGEVGHNYSIEYGAVQGYLSQLQSALAQLRDSPGELAPRLKRSRAEVTKAILAIRTEVDSEVLEAHSPFQAYCKLKAFCEAVNQKLVWADPYMGPGLLHRYLNGLPDSVKVVLVTKDRSNKSEYQSFLDISRLCAQERGPIKYRLVVESANHDRWLRCDDQLYHLGGSAKDAGRRSDFTITKLEPTPANFQKLDDLISSGTELFGPSTPKHA